RRGNPADRDPPGGRPSPCLRARRRVRAWRLPTARPCRAIFRENPKPVERAPFRTRSPRRIQPDSLRRRTVPTDRIAVGAVAGEVAQTGCGASLLHGFLSRHLHGSDGVVALVLVGMEIYKPAGALRTRRILFHHFNAHGGARELVTVIVDVLPGLVVHLEGAHFGSCPRGRIAHFDGAGAGGKFTTISGQYLDKLI